MRFQLRTKNTDRKGLHLYNPRVEFISINQNPCELGFSKITNLFTSDFNFQSPIKLALRQRDGPR